MRTRTGKRTGTGIVMLAMAMTAWPQGQNLGQRRIRRPAGKAVIKLGPKQTLHILRMPTAMERTLESQAEAARQERMLVPAVRRGVVNGGMGSRTMVNGGSATPMLATGNSGGTLLGGSPEPGTPGTPGTPTPATGGPAGMVPSRSTGPRMTQAPHAAAPGPAPATSVTSRLGRLGEQETVACVHAGTTPSIASVSGKQHGAVFTPEVGTGANPLNQYTIRGCNFGTSMGRLQLVGAFQHHGPIALMPDSWSDQLIVATLDPNLDDEYDLDNITLTVITANGPEAQLPGNSFYAARASRPLTVIPHGYVKQPDAYPYVLTQTFISAVNTGTLMQGQADVAIAPVAQAEQWTAYVAHGLQFNGDFPSSPPTWSQAVDFSGLRPGFTLDDSFQVAALDILPEGCQTSAPVVTAQMAGQTLQITEQPQLCNDGVNFAAADYGLILTVTGPKGKDLSPWPDGVQP